MHVNIPDLGHPSDSESLPQVVPPASSPEWYTDYVATSGVSDGSGEFMNKNESAQGNR